MECLLCFLELDIQQSRSQEMYKLSCSSLQVHVLFKAQNSTTVYAEATFEGINSHWRKFSANITANATDFEAEVALQL